jgi:hypothetical protein
MTRNQTFRPRINREQRDRLIEVANELNGEPVSGTNQALGLVVRYLNVLDGQPMQCPDCGEELEPKAGGNHYHCWNEDKYLSVFEVLGSDNPENASIHALPKHVKYRFAPDDENTEAGTKGTDSSQHTQSTTPDTTNIAQHGQNTDFDW